MPRYLCSTIFQSLLGPRRFCGTGILPVTTRPGRPCHVLGATPPRRVVKRPRSAMVQKCARHHFLGTLVLIVAGSFFCPGMPAFAAQIMRQGAARPVPVEPSGELFTLHGNTRREAMIPAYDRGRVADDLQLPHLQLLLERSAAQEQ